MFRISYALKTEQNSWHLKNVTTEKKKEKKKQDVSLPRSQISMH